MPNTAINIGRLLVLVGGFGYAFGYMNGRTSVTALIPAFFGLALMVLGYVARAKEGLRKHVMHVAVLLALLGFLASAGRLVMKASEINFSAPYIAQILMAVLCLLFVFLGIRSFMAARSN